MKNNHFMGKIETFRNYDAEVGTLLKMIREQRSGFGKEIVFLGKNGFRGYPMGELYAFLTMKRNLNKIFRIEIIDKNKENIYDVLLTRIQ